MNETRFSLRSLLSPFVLAVAAGLFIGIGGTVLLSMEDKLSGAVLFSVALLSICTLGLSLFTGRVGDLTESHRPADFAVLGTVLLGNALGCFLTATGVRLCRPALIEKAVTLTTPKLSGNWLSVLVAGVFCGMLMYTAVAIYRERSSVVGIFLAVPTFILCGFEHSIADMFYFFLAGEYSLSMLGFLALVVVGNALGGCLVPLCRKALIRPSNSNT